MKFHGNVSAMVLFRFSRNHLITSKTVVVMETKLRNLGNLRKPSCLKP